MNTRNIKYYEVAVEKGEEMMIQSTIEIDRKRATDFLSMHQVIGVKGKTPRVGDRIKLEYYITNQKAVGFVTEVSPDGIPVKARLLDSVEVIELVGHIIRLLNLAEALWLEVKEILNKIKKDQ